MADAVYPKAKEAFLSGSIDLTSDNIKMCLVDTLTYTYSSSDQYMNYDTVPSSAQIAMTGNLAGKSVTNGVFDATDPTFSSVTGNESEALIIFKDGGGGGTTQSGTTDPLIAYIDSATGLPVTPNGGDINVTFDSGADKIFAI